MNLYDFIQFPIQEHRERFREIYPNLFKFKQIRTNHLSKYTSEATFDILDYYTTGRTWIDEFNYAVFAMMIPLYSMTYLYDQLSSHPEEEGAKEREFLFFHYGEVVLYYLDRAFKKSLLIFTSVFDIKIESNSITELISCINKSNSPMAKKVKNHLSLINKSSVYKKIISYRNANTHSVRYSVIGYENLYDKKNGITYQTQTSPVSREDLFVTISSGIVLLYDYTTFIDETIEEYYDFVFKKL